MCSGMKCPWAIPVKNVRLHDDRLSAPAVGLYHVLPAIETDALIADKAFDADARVLEPLAAAGETAVIPPRSNRGAPVDREPFAKIKQLRAIATRSERRAELPRCRPFVASVVSLNR